MGGYGALVVEKGGERKKTITKLSKRLGAFCSACSLADPFHRACVVAGGASAVLFLNKL